LAEMFSTCRNLSPSLAGNTSVVTNSLAPLEHAAKRKLQFSSVDTIPCGAGEFGAANMLATMHHFASAETSPAAASEDFFLPLAERRPAGSEALSTISRSQSI
jgi:hypothetical protein